MNEMNANLYNNFYLCLKKGRSYPQKTPCHAHTLHRLSPHLHLQTTTHIPMTYTIISALKETLTQSQNSQLKTENLEHCQEALHYLTQKLHINEFQAIVLSIVINNDEEIYTSEISSHLDISLLEFLLHTPDIDDLVNRKYLRRIIESDEVHPSYKIQKTAMDALMHNEDYTAPSRHCDNPIQFLISINTLKDSYHHIDMCDEEFQSELLLLTLENQHLPLCQAIKGMDIVDQVIYYQCVFNLFTNNKEVTELTGIAIRHYGPIYNSMMEAFLTVQFPLLTQGIVTFTNEEKTAIRLSPDICAYLQKEFHQFRMYQKSRKETKSKEDEPVHNLINYKSISSQNLFYNPTEAAAINKLTDALQVENFHQVQKRLQSHKMSPGLTCLFYGAPGTGKTATVYQIAHATQRHILQIDFAQIRSKWVGDSEKNIREIFAQYQLRCQEEEHLPILLINEADGLISRRIANIKYTHDKDENVLQNIMLEEMEQFQGILIATTNLQDNLDRAFERRFLYKIQFHQPTLDTQQKIWQSRFPEITPEEAHTLSQQYNFSGAQIENITRKHLIENALTGETTSLFLLQNYCNQEIMESQSNLKPISGFRR